MTPRTVDVDRAGGPDGGLRASFAGLAAGSGAVVLLDTGLHPDGVAALSGLAQSFRDAGREVFRASAWPPQRPFELVSRALGSAVESGTAAGSETAAARGVDAAANTPFAPVSDRTGASLLPREAVAEFRAVSGVLAHLARRAALAPVLMVLEDLQWADPGSITFATRLANHTRAAPILLVATHDRSLPSAPFVHFLQAAAARRRECEDTAEREGSTAPLPGAAS